MPSKKEMQQAYRSKETQGFQDLHCALQTVDPHSPIQRDVARYQLLSMAAKRLRELAHEKQVLSQELSLRRQSQSPRPPHMYAPNGLLCSPDQVFPLGTTSVDSVYDDGYVSYTPEMRTVTFNTNTNVHPAYYGAPYYTGGRV